MPGDYIPPQDADFDAWQINFLTYANANLAGLGLVAADVNPLNTASGTWTAAYQAHVAAQASAESATQGKKVARTSFVALIRALVARLQASPQVDDAERGALGITVPGGPGIPGGPPTTRPLLTVECGRLQHTLGFMDESTPGKKAKPPGVMGAEIWVKIGSPPPTDVGEMDFLALDTRTPHVAVYGGADGNKIAYYWARWVKTTGEKGPWSEMASATIGA